MDKINEVIWKYHDEAERNIYIRNYINAIITMHDIHRSFVIIVMIMSMTLWFILIWIWGMYAYIFLAVLYSTVITSFWFIMWLELDKN